MRKTRRARSTTSVRRWYRFRHCQSAPSDTAWRTAVPAATPASSRAVAPPALLLWAAAEWTHAHDAEFRRRRRSGCRRAAAGRRRGARRGRRQRSGELNTLSDERLHVSAGETIPGWRGRCRATRAYWRGARRCRARDSGCPRRPSCLLRWLQSCPRRRSLRSFPPFRWSLRRPSRLWSPQRLWHRSFR